MPTDDTAELQALVDAAQGGTLSLDRDYYCDATAWCYGPLRLEGNSHTIGRATKGKVPTDGTETERLRRRWNATLRMVGPGIEVHDLRVEGGNTEGGVNGPYDADLEAQHGIDLVGADGATLTEVHVAEVYGDGVYVDDSDRVTLRDLAVERTGRHGIGMSAGTDLLVDTSEFADIRRAHVDLEPHSVGDSIDRVLIRGGLWHACRLLPLAVGSRVGAVHNVTVRDLVINDPFRATIGHPAAVTRCGPFHLEGIVARKWFGTSRAARAVVGAYNVDGLTIERCVLPVQPGRDMTLVYAESCSGVKAIATDVQHAVAVASPLSTSVVQSTGCRIGADLTPADPLPDLPVQA